MDIIFATALILLFYKSRVYFNGTVNEDPYSIKTTTAINGFFTILIFIRHFFQYTEPTIGDRIIYFLNIHSGQLIVVSYLLFSGYASAYQIEKRGDAYVRKLPLKILRLWIYFVVAVFIYMLLGLSLGNNYDTPTIILSYIGIRDFGNSNWYVVAILFLWLFTFLSYSLGKNTFFRSLIFLTLLIAYVVVFKFITNQTYYNTVVCYAIGLALYYKKDDIANFISNNKSLCLFTSLMLMCIFCIIWCKWVHNFYIFEIATISFTIFIIILCHFIQFGNPIIEWLGKYAFEIYILQRIPMILLKGRISSNVIYFLICFCVTICLSLIYKKVENCIDFILELMFSSKDI